MRDAKHRNPSQPLTTPHNPSPPLTTPHNSSPPLTMKLPPFFLERHFAQYEFEVPYQLSCSDCEPLRMNELLAMASPESLQLWEDLQFYYTSTTGHPLLRKEVATLYEGISSDNILICAPGEGIFLAMTALLEKGDHVVVISPAYQSLHEIAAGIGCRVIPWEADANGNYQVESLKALVTGKTRMVVVNLPHNPTGSMVSAEDFIEISRFCDLNGIVLFSDEMYRGLELDPAERLPGAASLSINAVSLSGMSKSFSLPGLRIGWLVCRNPQFLSKLLQLKDYTTICSSAPSDILSIIALQNRDSILQRNRDIIGWNIRLVDQFIEDNRGLFSWKPPVAGSVAMLNLHSGQTSEKFCQDLLVEEQVLAIGSHLFNMPKPAIRLGLGRVGFAEALEKVTRLPCISSKF